MKVNFFVEVHEASRRLQNVPAYADFIMIVGLCLLLYSMLQILMGISRAWKQMMNRRIAAAMAKRKSVKDDFRSRNGYSWDYVIIFKVFGPQEIESEAQKKNNMKFILNQLSEAGLETKMFYSVMRQHVFCKIRAGMTRLVREADRIGYKLQLDSAGISNYLAEGKRYEKISPDGKQRCIL